MPTARVRSALARIPLGRAVVALGLVLVGINVASAIWDVYAARERIERRAQRDFTNVTNLLAEQTAGSLKAVDVILRDMVRAGTAQTVAQEVPRLRDELAHVSNIATLLVLDTQGRLLAHTGEVPAIDTDRAGLALVRAHRDAGTGGLQLRELNREGIGGAQRRFLLSRRLNEPSGRFGGVVAAAIEVESFDLLYRTI